MTTRVPDWLLERFALGELPTERMEQVRADLEAESGGRARLEALERSNEALLAKMPPRRFAAAVEELAAHREPRPWLAALMVAIPVLAVLLVAPLLFTGIGESDGVRAKGDPQIQLHRHGTADDEKLADGARVREGDLVQVSYTASGAPFGAVVSVDGRGTVTWHMPAEGRTAIPLRGGGSVPLDHAYELDDAPEFERFLLVTGPDSFDLGPVERTLRKWAAAGADGDPALDPHLRTTILSLNKEEVR